MRIIIAVTGLLTLTVLTLAIIAPPLARAASISDSAAMAAQQPRNSTTVVNPTQTQTQTQTQTEKSLSTTGSTEQPPVPTGPQKITLTIIPAKEIVGIGKSVNILISAKSENGSGIAGAKVVTDIGDYPTGKQRVLLGGTTDNKGELVVTPTIGTHAVAGQFLVTANASKSNFDDASVSSGFTVADRGSGSGSGSSGSGGGSGGKSGGSGRGG